MSGGGDFQKIPLVRTAQLVAERKAQAAIDLLGKALPASVVSRTGSIVTVKFELTKIPFNLPQVTVPIAGSEYVRVPVQAGCKGVVFPADASIGGMSGLGAANASLAQPANLSSLVFFPIGNKSWDAPEHPDHLELYGVDGVLIKNKQSKDWYVEVTANGVTISNAGGSASIAWNGAAWEFKGPVKFDDLATFANGMQMSGNITAVGGGIYGGNFITSGTIQSGAISLTAHHHTAQGATAPTTAAQA